MSSFINFISSHQELSQILFYGFLIVSLWIFENTTSNFSIHQKIRHSKSNVGLVLTAIPVQFVIAGVIIVAVSWVGKHHLGLLNHMHLNAHNWLFYVAGFLTLDLAEYIYHVLMHKTAFLWRFHLVHHSDSHVDASTTLREHPCETLIRTSFLLLWVLLIGPNILLLMIRQGFQSVFNILSHAEFRFPEKLNRILSVIFITPNLHHVHHHYQLPYTDRNYGDVLCIWDRLFGTYSVLEQNKTHYGIDVHMELKDDENYLTILKLPFKKKV